ncbi:MAG: HD domain-containing protein [Spirochaetia bacterium]|nr:HD domain-containing protein [Spirochaetia bacterium]
MKKLKVSELKPGMVFDQPVYIDSSNLLLQSGQELQAKDIERLMKWGILEVQTNGGVVQQTTAEKEILPPPVAAALDPGNPDISKIAADYDTFRKARFNIKSMIQQGADILGANMIALTEGKPFDNSALLNLAGKLVDEVQSKRFFLLAFHGMRIKAPTQVYHNIQAAAYATAMASSMNYTRPRTQELVFSVLVMDAGMYQIPGHVRDKAGALADQERAALRSHPIIGNQLLLKNAKVKPALANVALQHHEYFDGSGYPQSLRAAQIEETARIALIADSYTAMIEKRPHRPGMLPYDAMKTMLSVDTGRFDPKLLRAFLGRLSIYPTGSIVQLSDKRMGMTLGCRPEKPLRPILRLLRDESGLPFSQLNFVDLFQASDLYIVRALDPLGAGIDLEAEI